MTSTEQTAAPTERPRRTSTRTLWLVVAVCVAPVFASYFLYYGVRPEGRTNYGDLLSPQVEVSALTTRVVVTQKAESGFIDVLGALPAEDARKALASLADFRGRWLLVRVGPSACDANCEKQLWLMRQLRLTTGRDRDRVERVWLVTSPQAPEPSAQTLADYEGTWVVAVGPDAVADWPLTVDAPSVSGRPPSSGTAAATGPSQPSSHLWLVDPLGNLMMRFPTDPDPAKMKKDLLKLLKASRVG